CMTVIMSFVALAIDGGLLMDMQMRVQAAADAAALAAAEDLFLNYQTNLGLDPKGTAKAAAIANAKANGFTNVTVNIPPLSGPFILQPAYAEVYVHYDQTRYFSTIFGSTVVPIQCRAVAVGAWKSAKMGILVLDPTKPGALTDTGNGSLTVTGAPLIINSNAP